MQRPVLTILLFILAAGGSVSPALANPPATPVPEPTSRFPMPALPAFLYQEDEAQEEEESRWNFLFEVGASITGGNSRTRDIDGKLEAKREWTEDRFFGYIRAEWGESQQNNTGPTQRDKNRQTAGGKWEHTLSGDLYAYLLQDFERDEFKDIKLRSETFVGLGNKLYEDEDHLLKGEIGVGYVATNFYDESNDTSASGRLAEHWEWTINENWDLVQDFELISNLEEIDDDFRTTTTVDVRTDLSENLYLSFSAEHRYDAEPATDDNGRTNRQDYKFLIKLGYRF